MSDVYSGQQRFASPTEALDRRQARDDKTIAMTYEETLAHFGVRGMHWGVRKESPSGSSNPSRKELRGMNKVARAENKAARSAAIKKANDEHDAMVLQARNNLSAAKSKYKDAKTQYKTEKVQIGKVAAKRALHAARDDYGKTWSKANELTAKEQQRRDRIEIGLTVAEVLLKSAR